jgi:hypothetical protein
MRTAYVTTAHEALRVFLLCSIATSSNTARMFFSVLAEHSIYLTHFVRFDISSP